MKTFMNVIAIAAIASTAIYSQKPNAPAVPAVAKPAAPAVAAPAQPVAQPVVATPAATMVGQPGMFAFWEQAAITVQLYGGINLATKSTYMTAVDAGFGTTGTYLGPAFGATFWYGNKVSSLGLSSGYQTPYSNTSGSNTQKVTQIPVVAYFRYFAIPNLYVGIGGGIAINLMKIDVGSSTTYTAMVPIAALKVGYDFELTKNIFLGAAVDLSYYFWNVNQKATTSGTASDYSANALNITPVVTVGMRF